MTLKILVLIFSFYSRSLSRGSKTIKEWRWVKGETTDSETGQGLGMECHLRPARLGPRAGSTPRCGVLPLLTQTENAVPGAGHGCLPVLTAMQWGIILKTG